MGKNTATKGVDLAGIQQATVKAIAPFFEGDLHESVATGSTGVTIASDGHTEFSNSTGGGVRALTLAAPVAGSNKSLFCTAISTSTVTDSVAVTCAAGVTFDGSANVATFNAAGESLTLVARSATLWNILVNTGAVSLSTA